MKREDIEKAAGLIYHDDVAQEFVAFAIQQVNAALEEAAARAAADGYVHVSEIRAVKIK